ncbi:MAG TPA: FAD-dependent oxidoreductase [Verrucomicrobiae bacterium]|jgi:pyruvate/2-oxoglutarate dehydrogenase complex dihydrolipoamide dehydrogenase (E3) component|nr:FAD-dependent oxidoreductase [Verrucomicrobiae bacterium]
MVSESCQNLIIGSGESGKYLAWTLAKLGQKTIVVERSLIGGSCPNIACLPSKNVIHSAKVASFVQRAAEFGVVTGPVTVDMAGVFRRKKAMVDGLIQVHLDNYRASGAELVMGTATFTEPKIVQVTLNDGSARSLRGERVFLNVGTHATIPNVPGLADAHPMTHIEALNLQRLPSHLVILGGGYVGLEFAQAMRRFGSRVTVIQHGPKLLQREDPDVTEALLQLMQDEGIEVLLNTEVLKVTGQSGESLQLDLRTENIARAINASDILVAAGRTPNTNRLAVEKAGIELDARGYLRVNEKLETTAPGVWAMGECAGSPQFTHVAYDDFRIVRDNLAGKNRTTCDRLIPYCLFTDPELAHVGLHESEAKARGISYRLAKMPMKSVLRARTLSETRGFLKASIGDDDRILGFTAFGTEAGETAAVVQTAMLGAMPYTAIRDAVFTHPTIAEGLVFLFASVPART